tara:strand:+ start:153 stop:557 length:405 start_codon:yes stop_codon:yes gene_type:complete
MKKFCLIILLVYFLKSCTDFKQKKSMDQTINNSELKDLITENDKNIKGVYYCKKCNSPLYKSENKYKSDYDDESFDKSIDNKVEYKKNFINKTKLECKKCGAQLGNVWDDGPKSTGNRHCVTKNALIFKTLKIN